MAEKNTQSIAGFFKSAYDVVLGERDFKYLKEATFAVVLGALAVGAYYGHSWYRNHQEQVAHQLFAHNVDEFERVLQDGKKEEWANVETLFKLGYDQYSSSSLAPYFLMYQAEAMIKQEKPENDVLNVMARAVSSMSASAPLTPLFKVKLALMELELKDENNKKSAIETLKSIASDTKSTGYDLASYYLGLHYWQKNELAQAKEVWQKLIDSQKDVPQQGQSPWAMMAQSKLGQIA